MAHSHQLHLMVLLWIFSVGIFFYIELYEGENIPEPNVRIDKRREETSSVTDEKLITILIWTYFNDSKMWWYGFRKDFGHEPFIKHGCKNTNCNLIYNRSKLAEADFLMFYQSEDPEWPEVRYPGQSYIHVLNERPGRWHQWLKDYDDKINITMNYRLDADIYFMNQGFHRHKQLLKQAYQPKFSLSSKSRTAVWMVSHCKAESKRDDYAAELGRYIDIDIYGECGNYTCPRGWTGTYECFEEFQKKYMFYLSFENAFCEDYVTEKLYRPLAYELVPIVLGSANYTRVAPPHSVIDIRDYESPKVLARYLKHLAENEDEYYEYFAWKQWYGLQSLQDCYCTLCDALTDPKIANKKAGGYYKWWFSGCDNSYLGRMREKANW